MQRLRVQPRRGRGGGGGLRGRRAAGRGGHEARGKGEAEHGEQVEPAAQQGGAQQGVQRRDPPRAGRRRGERGVLGGVRLLLARLLVLGGAPRVRLLLARLLVPQLAVARLLEKVVIAAAHEAPAGKEERRRARPRRRCDALVVPEAEAVGGGLRGTQRGARESSQQRAALLSALLSILLCGACARRGGLGVVQPTVRGQPVRDDVLRPRGPERERGEPEQQQQQQLGHVEGDDRGAGAQRRGVQRGEAEERRRQPAREQGEPRHGVGEGVATAQQQQGLGERVGVQQGEQQQGGQQPLVGQQVGRKEVGGAPPVPAQ